MATQPFNAAAWFATWCDHGVIAMLIGNRVWIGRTAALDREATQRLNQLRAPSPPPTLKRRWWGFSGRMPPVPNT